MNGKASRNCAGSIRARLLNYAKQRGDDYQRVLTRFAIERLLYRLGLTDAAERYVLKGATLFLTWPEHVYRPSADLDLLGMGNPDPDAIIRLFTQICRVEAPDDGIVFDPATLKADPVREANRYHGVQLSLKGELAKAAIPVQVDIGFGDHVYPPPKRRIFPALLPDLPAPSILMYPPETVVAEKFEAMTRFGEANGRIKDFHDIWVMMRTFPFELCTLMEAIHGTLRRRETAIPTEMPVGLTEVFAKIAEERGLWTGFLRRSPPALRPPPFVGLLQELRRFFGPVIARLARPEEAPARWDPNNAAWH